MARLIGAPAARGESVVLVQDGVSTPLFTIVARPIDLKIRHDSIWAAYDRFVIRLAPGEPPTVIGPESGLPAGGRMLVDREPAAHVRPAVGGERSLQPPPRAESADEDPAPTAAPAGEAAPEAPPAPDAPAHAAPATPAPTTTTRPPRPMFTLRATRKKSLPARRFSL